jgi:hypothetical protein
MTDSRPEETSSDVNEEEKAEAVAETELDGIAGGGGPSMGTGGWVGGTSPG